MIEINEVLFIGLMIGMCILGTLIGVLSTRDYRKMLNDEYNKKQNEVYETVRKEVKGEWAKGWDAAYKSAGVISRKYYLWFREHGYNPQDIEKWADDYMKNL